MPQQDKGANENEDIKKGVIVSDKVGIDVHKSAIGFIYASREFNRRGGRAVPSGMLNIFVSQSDMDSCRNTYRHYYCRCGIRTADCGD